MLGPLFLGLFSGEAGALIGRARSAAVTYVSAAVLLLLGAGFLLAAAFIWLETQVRPVYAALIFAGVFILAGVAILIVYRIGAKARAAQDRERRNAELKALGVTTALAVLPSLTGRQKGLAMVAVPILAAAGFGISRLMSPKPPPEPRDRRPRRR